jgi:hypothetical protein
MLYAYNSDRIHIFLKIKSVFVSNNEQYDYAVFHHIIIVFVDVGKEIKRSR